MYCRMRMAGLKRAHEVMVARKKGKKGAFLKGHAGYGQRNADADAADEPDAGASARANECHAPLSHLHTHARDPHECTHTRTRTRTHARTHTATHCKTHTPRMLQ